MQLTSKYNKGFRFILCVADIHSKYAWAAPLKDKKGVTFTSLSKSFEWIWAKTKQIWVDKVSEFYNRLLKSWLQDSDIEMYSTYNKRRSVVAERSIGTIKNKIYKYMTSVSQNVYIDKLNDIINEYNDAYHRTILNEAGWCKVKHVYWFWCRQ